MNNSTIKNKIISLILFILVVSCILIMLFYNYKLNTDMITLERNWTVYKNGILQNDQPNDKLIKYVLPKMSVGDEITLSYKLNKYDIKNPKIVFDTWHCITEVYLHNQKLYSWGEQLYENNHMLGNKRHFIELPDLYEGKVLSIKLKATENDAMKQFYSVLVTEFGNNLNFWFNRSLALTLSALLIIIIGLIIFVFSYLMLFKTNKFLSAIMLGITFQLMGIYFLCRSNIIQLIIPDPLIYNQIEFLSLYMLPLPLISYTYNVTEKPKSKKAVKCYYLYLLTYIIGMLFIIYLHNNTNIHYTKFLFIYYFITLISYIISIIFLNKEDKNKLDIKLTILAIKVFFIGSLLSLLAFHTKGIPSINHMFKLWLIYDHILSISSFIMLILFFIGFYHTIRNMFLLKFENEKLHYVAYHDALTMLQNKRSFNKHMTKLNEDNNKYYALIVIDINNLKITNDTLGHNVGDKIIIGLATTLLKIPEHIGSPYRIGGDEFTIIVYNSEHIDEIINQINDNLHLYNENNKDIQISISIGTSSKVNNPNIDSFELLSLADRDMYEQKQRIKSLTK